jgi:hypothetical protein
VTLALASGLARSLTLFCKTQTACEDMGRKRDKNKIHLFIEKRIPELARLAPQSTKKPPMVLVKKSARGGLHF